MALKKTKVYHGAPAEDIRPEEAKRKDWLHIELAGAGAPVFQEKPVEALNFYERRDQDGSSTCMNQAKAKQRGIEMKKRSGKYISLSGGFLYRRKNTIGEGMAIWDVFELDKKYGSPFELIDPSQNMSEKEIVNAKEIPYADEVAKLFTDPDESFIYITRDYFNTIASVVNSGTPVLLMHFGEFDEYGIIPKVKYPNLTRSDASIRHGVCVVDTVRYKGVDYLVMDESWGIPNSSAPDAYTKALKQRGQRLLSREWVTKRCYGAGYITQLNFAWQPPLSPLPPVEPSKPRHTFLTDLEWGMENDEVKALQNCLKYEGLFPIDQVSTGAYYGITQAAVQKFQSKHGIILSGTPETTGYGRVGPKTRTKLNQIYG